MDNTKKIIGNRILIIQLGGIGDVLLSFPALRLLKKNSKEICLLGLERGLNLVQAYFPEFKLIKFPFDPFRYNLTNMIQFFNLLAKVKEIEADSVVNLQPITSLKASLPIFSIMKSSGAKVMVGRNTGGRGWFLSHKISEELGEGKFEGEYGLELAELATGRNQQCRNFSVDLNEEMLKKTARYEFPENMKVGICMGGKLPEQRWGDEKYHVVINRIMDATDYNVMLIGERTENDLYEFPNKRIWDYRGKTDNVSDLIALISKVDVFISNDTGPMHIACALKKKVIALFREYTFPRFSWKSDNIFNLVAAKVDDIPVDEVWQKLLGLICEKK